MGSTINNSIYDELAHTWWDENEFLHLLKVMVNPWRVPYFKNALVEYYGQSLNHVRLLDIGCGGGVLAEEFALMGCRVTGIDISPRSITVARAHAAKAAFPLTISLARRRVCPLRTAALKPSVAAMCWSIYRIGKR